MIALPGLCHLLAGIDKKQWPRFLHLLRGTATRQPQQKYPYLRTAAALPLPAYSRPGVAGGNQNRAAGLSHRLHLVASSGAAPPPHVAWENRFVINSPLTSLAAKNWKAA